MLGAGFFLVLLWMMSLWIFYLFKRNAGIIDVGWAISFILCAWAYFFLGQGAILKKLLMTFMVTVWAGRLAWHLYNRMLSSEEEPRYVELRRNWGGDPSNFLFLMLFMLQGVIAVVLSIPFLVVNANALLSWDHWEIVGFLVWLIGVGGEALADSQLAAFHQNPENKGKVCRNGLWFYSRHPNYFFEFLVWVGFFLFAIGSPFGWVSIISPLMILGLLLKGSGIPLNEAQALRTKGTEYEKYQKTTPGFIPWFPKNEP
jgi:steroid 5-alpha reductase family enzyme